MLATIEEIAKACATSALILTVQELGALALKLAGTEEQRERYLPRLATGERLAAYALTEAGSGSDAAAMLSHAVRDGDEYVLDGQKRFITNAGVADLYTVFAKTDPAAGHDGISCFLVEARCPASRFCASSRKWASPARRPASSPSTASGFRSRTCIGAEGEGFRIAMRILDRSRPGSPRRRSGSRRARPTTRSSTRRTRETMGKPIAEHQLIAAKLADMETQCEAARGLLYRFGQMVDAGVEDAQLTKASAQAKLFCPTLRCA